MLTTLATVKTRLGIAESDVKDDDLLTTIIAAVSARCENEANRKFGYATGLQAEFQGDETELRPARCPIDETVAITFDLQSNAVDGWQTLAPQPEYIVRHGCVISLTAIQGTWKQKLRVTYAGGYLLPDGTTAGTVALPDDLVYAAMEQVVYVYQNKDRVGVTSMSTQGGSISLGKMDLLPSVAQVLGKYERWMP